MNNFHFTQLLFICTRSTIKYYHDTAPSFMLVKYEVKYVKLQYWVCTSTSILVEVFIAGCMSFLIWIFELSNDDYYMRTSFVIFTKFQSLDILDFFRCLFLYYKTFSERLFSPGWEIVLILLFTVRGDTSFHEILISFIHLFCFTIEWVCMTLQSYHNVSCEFNL